MSFTVDDNFLDLLGLDIKMDNSKKVGVQRRVDNKITAAADASDAGGVEEMGLRDFVRERLKTEHDGEYENIDMLWSTLQEILEEINQKALRKPEGGGGLGIQRPGGRGSILYKKSSRLMSSEIRCRLFFGNGNSTVFKKSQLKKIVNAAKRRKKIEEEIEVKQQEKEKRDEIKNLYTRSGKQHWRESKAIKDAEKREGKWLGRFSSDKKLTENKVERRQRSVIRALRVPEELVRGLLGFADGFLHNLGLPSYISFKLSPKKKKPTAEFKGLTEDGRVKMDFTFPKNPGERDVDWMAKRLIGAIKEHDAVPMVSWKSFRNMSRSGQAQFIRILIENGIYVDGIPEKILSGGAVQKIISRKKIGGILGKMYRGASYKALKGANKKLAEELEEYEHQRIPNLRVEAPAGH